MGIHYFLCVGALLFTIGTFAQWTRVVNPFPFSTYHSGSMGSGVSFFDVDEDGWDDITLASNGHPTIYYHNNQGTFEQTYLFPNTGDAKSCVWVDIENDGDNDLIVSRFGSPLQVFLNEGENTFIEALSFFQFAESSSTENWGIALSDVNRDSYLDVAVANFSMTNPNCLFTNSNGGSMMQSSQAAMSGISHMSFQPAFADIDNDLYPELFFCNDHEQGNEFYQLDSNGVFSDYSAASGLLYPADGMSSAWCDVDHDYDFDLFVSNSPWAPYLHMINDGMGQFLPDTVSELTFGQQGWGSLFIDAENDGWDDLFICTQMGQAIGEGNNIYLHNENGVLTDSEIATMTDLSIGFYCNAKGDYNNDGRCDIIANPEAIQSLHLFENTSNSVAHYIKFRLNGRLSNRNGFGAHYASYCSDFITHGYTQCGENYLSQNSQNILLGLGEHISIDSFIVNWPSGIVDKYFNLQVDQFIELTEAETIDEIVIDYDPCGIALPTASVNPLFTEVIWSTGASNTPSISANTDSLTAIVSTGFGNSILLSAGQINTNIASRSWEITPPVCTVSQGLAHLHWAINNPTYDFDTTFQISHGFNYITYITPTGCTVHDTLYSEAEYALTILNTESHPICQGQSEGSVEIITKSEYSTGLFDSTSYTIEGLAAGWNSGIITDNHLCTVDWSAWIPQSTWNISTTQPLCPDDNSGEILVEYFSGETSMFIDSLDELLPGNYDRFYNEMPDGCSFQWELFLSSAESFLWDLDYPLNVCSGDSFTLSTTLWTMGEVIQWNGPISGSVLPADTYTIDVLTTSGCSSSVQFTVDEFEPIEFEYSIDYSNLPPEISIESEEDDYFSCVWSNGNVGNQLTANAPGVYTFTITNENNCTYTDSIAVESWTATTENNISYFTIRRNTLVSYFPMNDVRISSLNGQLILHKNQFNPGESIALASGAYLVWSRELTPRRVVVN